MARQFLNVRKEVDSDIPILKQQGKAEYAKLQSEHATIPSKWSTFAHTAVMLITDQRYQRCNPPGNISNGMANRSMRTGCLA